MASKVSFSPVALLCCWICASVVLVSTSWGQRNLKDIPDPDPEIERTSFQLPEGFEVNLYAADPLIAKPTQMNFDSKGRLWISSSEVYPQIEPGQIASDKILVLDDVDHDGVADKVEVFADGLLIPTGVLPGDGGAYTANSTELLHLSDTNSDGKADRQRVVLSGFGTEDTHHILHTLRWGPDGMLYMNQSIYIHSHIETPYGVRRMNGSGVWQFRPETMQLEIFTLGLVNPWGHAWDRFGQSLETDGAGGEGINYVFPGWVGKTSPGAKRVMNGLNPGKPKLCGLEVIGGSHLPEEWQGNLITNDFRAHRVCRYVLTDENSGFRSKEVNELIKTRHKAFRPIDVKLGPDGAIYIADWYNPIIQHGEVDFRDPRRDHVHGRIWRITYKDRPLVPRIDMTQLSVDELLAKIDSPEPWQRHHAKLQLKAKGADAVIPKLASFVASIQGNDRTADTRRLEALWVYQGLDHVNVSLIEQLLTSKQFQIRAAATRVLYHWSDRVESSVKLLAKSIEDDHPRVRLEAIRALSRVRKPQAAVVAGRALNYQPFDQNHDFALWTTFRDLSSEWIPAAETGKLKFDSIDHAIYALTANDASSSVPTLLRLLSTEEMNPAQQNAILGNLARLGQPADLRKVLDGLVNNKNLDAAAQASLLQSLVNTSKQRKVRPEGSLDGLLQLVKRDDPQLKAAAMSAAGSWKVKSMRQMVEFAAQQQTASEAVRRGAIEALVGYGGPESAALLESIATSKGTPGIRVFALSSLAKLNSKQASDVSAELLADESINPQPILESLIGRKDGPKQLANSLEGKAIPRDNAMMAVRTVRSSGQELSELVAAINRAGKLDQPREKLTANEVIALIADVQRHGNADRGEAIYRRASLNCIQCHAIGGAGGMVGPDLASIGASAPIDYLVESLYEPGKKIKENYHSLIVTTDEGQVVTGVKIRETDTELILRDANNVEKRVRLDSIEDTRDGGSLMPAALMDSLTRDEAVHMIRFLSELGKVGDYSLPKEKYVRSWEVLAKNDYNKEQLRRLRVEGFQPSDDRLLWAPVVSRVNGELVINELARFRPHSSTRNFSVARFNADTSNGRKVSFRVNQKSGISLWIDGKPTALVADNVVSSSNENAIVTIAVEHEKLDGDVLVELLDN